MDFKTNMKSWMEKLLKNENIDNLDVAILGNSEKGDGYMGDIVFAEVKGTTTEGICKKYNIALKCSKSSPSLREKSSVKEAFLNEIYFYDVIFPSFKKFQQDRKIDKLFENVPICYGTLSNGNMEVLALENLKSKGYILWNKAKPLTRKHIDMIVAEYGKFHAISIAMKDQEPRAFQKLIDGIENMFKKFQETCDIVNVYERIFDEIYNLLKNELDEDILDKWQGFKLQLRTFLFQISEHVEGENVILHGDCWNNNFMHYHKNDQPSTFAILDWQLIRYSSPVFDLSYLLFACLSEEDIYDMEQIKKHYHESLLEHLEKLGSCTSLYPVHQFLEEWRKHGKFGLLIVTLVHKICLAETNEIPDVGEAADKGDDIATGFGQPIKNTTDYKKRMKYIIKYAAENNLI
ncbi:hypothetical protein Zmor_001790 [Zophobas morio]|uniref:CHK kinase-like domain-containing protein n=1 Tax=Zophobas morio TaxID=2755281 RepID=A0AA38J865_9CUCU|nr:hypothetical protein Zmor_001790 [Zophobas morio]